MNLYHEPRPGKEPWLEGSVPPIPNPTAHVDKMRIINTQLCCDNEDCMVLCYLVEIEGVATPCPSCGKEGFVVNVTIERPITYPPPRRRRAGQPSEPHLSGLSGPSPLQGFCAYTTLHRAATCEGPWSGPRTPSVASRTRPVKHQSKV